MANAVIIGGGPAGISAAVYIARAGIEATLLYRDGGALLKAHDIRNYYGFPDGVSGEQLHELGLRQARALGVNVIKDEVQSINFEDTLVVKSSSGTFPADAVVLATGAVRKAPSLPGVRELEGRGVSYCAVCDGAFFRGKRVAVLGSGDFALHEAKELLPLASKVTLLTSGLPAPENLPGGIAADTRKVERIEGEESVAGVRFVDGERLELEAVFIAQGVAGAADFARRTGILMDGAGIATDRDMATNVPGLFAAGDCAGAPYQVAKAVEEGRRAGTAAVAYIRANTAQKTEA